MKKKMAFVDLNNFKDWPMGGMLEYELAILPHLCEHYDIDIYGYSVDGVKPSTLHINDRDYPVFSCGNCSTSSRIIPNFWRGMSLLKYKKQFADYDVIYAHTGSCMTALGKIVDKKRTKLVYHQHGLNFQTDFQLRSLIQRPFFGSAQRTSDLVFVVSDELSVKKYVKKNFPNSPTKYVAVGSPVNLAKFDKAKILSKLENRKNELAHNFVYTGRLTAYKNAKLLVQALALYVKNVTNDATLYIAGTGEEFDVIKQMAKDLNIEQNVKLLGFVPHDKVYGLLEQADVFLTASGGEGWSVSVLEANASGLPVICGKVPGLEKQVINDKTGLFVDQFTPEAFYEKMKEMNTKRYELSMRCLDYVTNFDSKVIASKLIENIDSLF